MMQKIESILKALDVCAKTELMEDCAECPYFKKGCLSALHEDIANLIKEQREEIEELTNEVIPVLKDGLKKLKAEN